MPDNVTKMAGAGLAVVQFGARNGNGIFQGAAKLTAADTGDSSGMLRHRGAVSAANPVPDVNRVRNRGEDGYIATHLFEAEPPEFNLEFEAADFDVEALATGISIATLGVWDVHGQGQGIPALQDMITMLARQAESEEAGATGNGYENVIIGSSKYRPTPGDFGWQAVGTHTLAGAADRVQLTPWGQSVLSFLGKQDTMVMRLFSNYPLTMVAFVGDGSLAVVPLPLPPVAVASTKFWRSDTGAALTVSSVNTGASTATLSAAPASGLLCVGLYETSGF